MCVYHHGHTRNPLMALSCAQMLTEPILFNSVCIEGIDQLVDFYVVISDREKKERPVDQLLKHLRLILPDPEEDYLSEYHWNVVVCILYLTPALQSFTMQGRPTLPCHMKTLMHFCATTLRAIDIVVLDGQITVFWCLGRLTGLRSAKIVCQEARKWQLEDTARIALPLLERFEWTCTDESPPHEMAAFLAGCAFARGGSFLLAIPHLPADRAQLLCDWISSHGLASLTLDMNADSLVSLRGPLSDIPDLRFLTAPPISLFDGHRWPGSISLTIKDEQPQPVYNFLDDALRICSSPETHVPLASRLRAIYINMSSGPAFTWDSASPEQEETYVSLTGRLMYYAFKLDKYAIHVLDGDKKTIRAYLATLSAS
jgi:hypothetical protein